MQTVRIVQAAALIGVVAMAASCEVSKAYTAKLFAPREATVKDSNITAVRFLDMEESEMDSVNWVKTDITRIKDTIQSTASLDKLSLTVPAKKDSLTKTSPDKTEVITAAPYAKNLFPGEIRTKKTRENK